MATDKVILNGVDVTYYRLAWVSEELWKEAIPSLTIEFSKSLETVMTISTASHIQVYRTLNITDDDFVFDGEITQAKPQQDRIICECKGRLIEAIKASQTKSWDKDIDTEAGIGSEIFKTLVTDSNLTFDSTSIVSTGTSTDQKITKFIQKEEDNYDRMNLLAEQYHYTIRYDNARGWVYFEPQGYTIYPYTLTVGNQIPTAIKWNENKEQIVNQVIVNGATVYDTLVQSFAGPATTFTLSKTPENTEVRVGTGAETGILKTRGQKGVGTIGVNYDYEIDSETKNLIFSGATSNVWIRYGAQVPVPVVLRDESSIAIYGGPNQTPTIKKVTYTDVKNLTDAEARGRAILAKYSTPFIEAQNIKVKESQIQLQVIKPGDLINIVDDYSHKNVTVFVRSVRKTYPQPMDEIDIGDKIWRTEDWQADQMKKINQIFNELQKNADIITQIYDYTISTSYEPRYMILTSEDRVGIAAGQFIFGDPVFGVIGTSQFGSSTLTTKTRIIKQGNNEYKEYFYDNDFIDVINTTSTIDTANFQVIN